MRNGEEFVINGSEVQTIADGDELLLRAKIRFAENKGAPYLIDISKSASVY